MKEKAYYNVPLTSNFEVLSDGGLLVHNVQIMGVGQWVSMQGQHTRFTPDILSRNYSKWEDNGVWLRHAGNSPRNVTEKVGAVRNPHYDPAVQAVIGDMYLHCRTEMSRAAATQVQMSKEDGGIKDVSAELVLEVESDGTVSDMIFTGLALVEDGACKTCKIPAYSAGGGESMADEKKKEEDKKAETPPLKEGTKADAQEGHESEMPESVEPEIIKLLAEALETVSPGISDIIADIMNNKGNAVMQARGMGKMDQALMGCHATMSAPSKDSAEFQAMEKEVKTLRVELAKTKKDEKANIKADMSVATENAESGKPRPFNKATYGFDRMYS